MCAAYGTSGHPIQERTVLVGYACERHSNSQQEASSSSGGYSDSGYGTASHGSHRHSSSRRHRRWNILPSMTGYSWHSRPLASFEFNHWVIYLFSFRGRTTSTPPSQLTMLFVGHDQSMARSAPLWSLSSQTAFHGWLSQGRAPIPLIFYQIKNNTRITYISRKHRKTIRMLWFLRVYRGRYLKKRGILHEAHANFPYIHHTPITDVWHDIVNLFFYQHCISGFLFQA